MQRPRGRYGVRPSFPGFPFTKLSLAGKTGTASANEQVPTSWFVGWGPVNNPQYLIAVVIEKGGYGASAAAPVARDGFQYLVANPVAPVDLKPPADGSGTPRPSPPPRPPPRPHGGPGRAAHDHDSTTHRGGSGGREAAWAAATERPGGPGAALDSAGT